MKILSLVLLTVILIATLQGCVPSFAEGVGIDQKWELDSQTQMRLAEEKSRTEIEVAQHQAKASIRRAEEEQAARTNEAFYEYKSWEVAGRTVFGVAFIIVLYMLIKHITQNSYFSIKLLGESSTGTPIVTIAELKRLEKKTGAIVRWESSRAQVQMPGGEWETFLLEEDYG